MDGWGTLYRRQLPGLGRYFDVGALRIPAGDRSNWDELSDRLLGIINTQSRSRLYQEIYLCGESFGGILALKTVLKAPPTITHLILVNPASSFHRRFWMAWGESMVPWIPDPLYPLSTLAIYWLLAAASRIDPRERQDLWQAIDAVPKATSAWRLSLLREGAVSAHLLQTIPQPTLILASGGDRLLPSVTEAQYLQQHIPQAQIIRLPNSGHACLLEREVNLAEILKTQGWIPSSSITPWQLPVVVIREP